VKPKVSYLAPTPGAKRDGQGRGDETLDGRGA